MVRLFQIFWAKESEVFFVLLFCVRRVRHVGTRTKVKSSYEEMVVRFENGYKHNKLRLSQWLHIEV